MTEDRKSLVVRADVNSSLSTTTTLGSANLAKPSAVALDTARSRSNNKGRRWRSRSNSIARSPRRLSAITADMRTLAATSDSLVSNSGAICGS